MFCCVFFFFLVYFSGIDLGFGEYETDISVTDKEFAKHLYQLLPKMNKTMQELFYDKIVAAKSNIPSIVNSKCAMYEKLLLDKQLSKQYLIFLCCFYL